MCFLISCLCHLNVPLSKEEEFLEKTEASALLIIDPENRRQLQRMNASKNECLQSVFVFLVCVPVYLAGMPSSPLKGCFFVSV